MDVSDYLDVKPAPLAVFDRLDERRTRPRFMLPADDGDWQSVTWGEFADTIRNCALFLDEVGVGTGDCTAIFGPNSIPWLAAAYGTQTTGAAFVPIYDSSTGEQARYHVDKSDAKVVFADTPDILSRIYEEWDAYEDISRLVVLGSETDAFEVLEDYHAEHGDGPAFGDVEQRLTTWQDVQEIGAALDNTRPGRLDELLGDLSLEDTAMMLFTSGTTGQPKGVPLTHENVASNGRDWVEVNGPQIDEQPVDLCWLPFSHVFGFGEISLGNTLGFTTYLTNPGDVLDQLGEVQPSVFMSIPRYWEKIAHRAMEGETDEECAERLDEVTGGRLEFCLSGGAGLKREIKEFFLDHDLFITEGYGLTEASPTLTMNRPDDFNFNSVGKPFPSVDVKLADDGEIMAKGPNIFEGYLDNPEATEETFTDDGWLKTGDLGEWTDDGFLKIVGRKKEILVTAGGKNIAPDHIEEKVDDDPLIENLVVYGDGKKYLVAGVWVDEEAAADRLDGDKLNGDERKRALRGVVESRMERINEELPSYETIKKFRVFDEPLTVDNGCLTPKRNVKRSEVYDKFGDELEALYDG
jgi:long-chain acyl-CoA synthetase